MKLLFLILLGSLDLAIAQPVLPVMPIHPVYFAVTDVDSNGLSSGFSNEIVWSNGPANLSWDAPTNAYDHFVLYWGFQSRTYTQSRALTSATNQIWPLPQPPAIWQKTFNYLHSADLAAWITNTVIICTITGAPPGNAGFDRAGPIRWIKIQ